MRYKIGTLSVALLLVACNSESSVENTSQYWTDFVASRDSASGLLDTSTTLPEERILQDYSFAGYKFSDTPLPAPAQQKRMLYTKCLMSKILGQYRMIQSAIKLR
ncbi:hypothetical protein [Vibrio harveyi]|uniref:hypothetical protein n=1 Tax=Vibrio harveyi TaxID=669 RepID=UPI000AA06FAC|nr:hypothetical protein [Vibrio harveyi]